MRPTGSTLPASQAEQYGTAYVAEVVAPEGDDTAAGAGENVVVADNSDIRIDRGWTLETAGGERLPLGVGRQIGAGTGLRVESSCGEDSEQAVFVCVHKKALDIEPGLVAMLDAAGTEVARLQYPVG